MRSQRRQMRRAELIAPPMSLGARAGHTGQGMIPTAFQAGGPPGAAHRRSAARLRLLRAAVRLATRNGSTSGSNSYLALELGGGLGGGVVECETRRPLWLPYVEVAEISEVTERARLLGASVLLEPREGPAGWRSVVAAPAGAEVAFWQPKG